MKNLSKIKKFLFRVFLTWWRIFTTLIWILAVMFHMLIEITFSFLIWLFTGISLSDTDYYINYGIIGIVDNLFDKIDNEIKKRL